MTLYNSTYLALHVWNYIHTFDPELGIMACYRTERSLTRRMMHIDMENDDGMYCFSNMQVQR